MRRYLEKRAPDLGLLPSEDGWPVTVERAGEPGEEAYELSVGPDGAVLRGGDERALLHAARTLVQWLRPSAAPDEDTAEWTCLEVRDRPSLAVRGAVLDVSRDRVPLMDTLLERIDRLAELKLNQVQLYTEHTFAYPQHPAVWEGASPITPEEWRALEAFCAERCVELVPNQQSFGHFHRWLVHPDYRHLAECPDGIDHPFSAEREPYGLCPTDPRALELLAGMYDVLLDGRRSREVHVGFDEPLDLGQGRSKASGEAPEELFASFLASVADLARERGHTVQFWADYLADRPHLLARVPRDATAVVWNYEAEPDLAAQLACLKEAGLAALVCGGTASWNSLAGRSDVALANVAACARLAREHGARGLLVADWGDFGHLQAETFSEVGWLAAAQCGWGGGWPAGADVAALLHAHSFPRSDPRLARAVLELGEVWRTAGPTCPNGSALFFLLTHPDLPLDHPRLASTDRAALRAARAELERVRADLADLSTDTRELREVRWTIDALALATDVGRVRLAGEPVAPLAAAMDRLRAAHADLWLARSRPGGLANAQRRLRIL